MAVSSFKRFVCLGVALGSFAATPALADPSGSWAGPYVGGYVGGTWANFTNNGGTPGPSGTDGSFMGGGNIGDNWQFGHAVIGIEGDASKIDNNGGSGGVKFDEDWVATLRGRLGYSVGQFLPYVTAGVAGTDTVSKVSGVGSVEKLQPGPAAGAGLDTMITNNWFARVEYLYTDVPKDSSSIGGTTVAGGSSNNTVRVGLDYKFW